MMIDIRTEKDSNQSEKHDQWVRCPECGTVLFDIQSLDGTASIRFRCRKCKTYSLIKAVGHTKQDFGMLISK